MSNRSKSSIPRRLATPPSQTQFLAPCRQQWFRQVSYPVPPRLQQLLLSHACRSKSCSLHLHVMLRFLKGGTVSTDTDLSQQIQLHKRRDCRPTMRLQLQMLRRNNPAIQPGLSQSSSQPSPSSMSAKVRLIPFYPPPGRSCANLFYSQVCSDDGILGRQCTNQCKCSDGSIKKYVDGVGCPL